MRFCLMSLSKDIKLNYYCTKLQFSVAMVTVKDVTGAALRCLQDI